MHKLTRLHHRPRSECHGVAQIFRKVTQGVKPQALGRVRSDELRALIEQCIAHDPEERPSARKLLKHSFFESLRMVGVAGVGQGARLSGVVVQGWVGGWCWVPSRWW